MRVSCTLLSTLGRLDARLLRVHTRALVHDYVVVEMIRGRVHGTVCIDAYYTTPFFVSPPTIHTAYTLRQ
jgi:hypothetical protein